MQPKLHTPHNQHTAEIATEFRDYAYSVSHDLSAPVRAMVEFSRLLTKEHAGSLDAEGREYLEAIIENGGKLQNMMQGLLQYSRLNTSAPGFSLIDMNEIVEGCRNILAKEIADAGVVFLVDELPCVLADADRIKQLFLILIENAIKFRTVSMTPYIRISATQQNSIWCFIVSDNGIGIGSEFQNKIFGLFKRLHTEEDYSGVGIGLTLAQKIVEHHGGRMGVNSCQGKGAAFHFTLQSEDGHIE